MEVILVLFKSFEVGMRFSIPLSFMSGLLFLILLPGFGPSCWGKSLKEAPRQILIREDGKGRLEIGCLAHVFEKPPQLECEITKTEISFPDDLFTTAKEREIQALKNSYQELGELLEEVPDLAFEDPTRQARFLDYYKDRCKSFIKMQKANELIFSLNLEEFCFPKQYTKEWALKLVSSFLESEIPTNQHACGILVENQKMKFNRLAKEKWSTTLENSRGLCSSVNYYELSVKYSKEENGQLSIVYFDPIDFTETLLSINPKPGNEKCDLMEDQLLKPMRWLVDAPKTLNLPCDQVDWGKLPAEQ